MMIWLSLGIKHRYMCGCIPLAPLNQASEPSYVSLVGIYERSVHDGLGWLALACASLRKVRMVCSFS